VLTLRVLEFEMDCVPPTTTHHRKKIVKVGGFSKLADTEKLVEAKDLLTALLIPHRPAAPFEGPVSLSMAFYWPWRQSEPKKNRAPDGKWMTSRPDCSNLAKTLEDRLVFLRFIEDDNCVARLVVEKVWHDRPRITVQIRELERRAAERKGEPQ
jgi:Holliday junction resolvase RusA-like endonuclease